MQPFVQVLSARTINRFPAFTNLAPKQEMINHINESKVIVGWSDGEEALCSSVKERKDNLHTNIYLKHFFLAFFRLIMRESLDWGDEEHVADAFMNKLR